MEMINYLAILGYMVQHVLLRVLDSDLQQLTFQHTHGGLSSLKWRMHYLNETQN